ncbi:MAG: hypothetical protein ACOC2B_04840 [Sediminispirochaetaceae bacterium]
MKWKTSAAVCAVGLACMYYFSSPAVSHSQEGEYRYPPELVPVAGAAPQKLLPEDEKIGALHDETTLTGEAVRILERAEQFFESLKKGRPDEKLLEAQSRRALIRFLGVSFDETISIEDVRYSEVKTGFKTEDERSASVELRIFSEYGDTRGELLFLWREEQWYISAVHLDFNELRDRGDSEETENEESAEQVF